MIPLAKPVIDFVSIEADLRNVLASGRLTDGPYVRAFESAVAEYVGVETAVATTSATTALHLALVGVGCGAGDEVLVSDFTFPATANAIVQTGATPVFVDCLPGSFLLDVSDAADRVTERTIGLVVVDPFGQPADLTACTRLASDRGLWMIEDAACALGASCDGRRCGSWGGAGCLSFHPRKTITTGEGGMILTNDAFYAGRLRQLRSHDAEPAEVGMRFEKSGFNYRMTEFQGVLGLAQMRELDGYLEQRKTLAELYMKRLESTRGIQVPLPTDNRISSFQSFVVVLKDGVDRDDVVRKLRADAIESTLGTYSLHAQEAFSRYGYEPGDLPNSWRAQNHSLALPLWPGMGSSSVHEVCDALEQVVTRQL